MVSMEQLEKMRLSPLDNEGADALTDISEVCIQGENALERLESLLRQVKNPYYFKVGKTPVRITFTQSAVPLEEKIKAHFISLRQKT